MHFVPDAYVAEEGSGTPGRRDPMVGRVIGQYLLVDVLGAGGLGKVYLALQLPSCFLKGALKLLTVQRDEHFAGVVADKFQTEAEALAELSHPNIVRLMAFGHHQERPYLVMEYVEGSRTLFRELWKAKQGGEGFTPERCLYILEQVLDGLRAAHVRGIVHRDIKPDNIMLQQVAGNPDLVRLVDFGLAKYVEGSAKTSTAMGTPAYMAPEQLAQRDIGPWTDLYAVAEIAFEMLTGRQAYTGDSHQVILARKIDPDFDVTEPLLQRGDPEGTVAFFRRALARALAERFGDTEEFRAALGPIFLPAGAPAAGAASGPTPLRSPSDPPWSARRSPVPAQEADPEAPQDVAAAANSARSSGPAGTLLEGAPDPAPVASLPTEIDQTSAALPPGAASRPAAANGSSRGGGRLGLTAGIAVAFAAIIGLLVWRPWGGSGPAEAPIPDPGAGAAVAAPAPPGWVRLEPGTVLMGSPPDEAGRYEDESPQRLVTLTRPFLLKATEVTQGEWRTLMETNPSKFSGCGDDCPVERVNFWDTLAWCNARSAAEGLGACYELQRCNDRKPGHGFECAGVRLEGGLACPGYRLPTEAEWEFAARAGTRTTLPTGGMTLRGERDSPELDLLAWYAGNAGVAYAGGYYCRNWTETQHSSENCGTHAAGTRQANPWGLHDMLGNVYEWCWDWYGDYASLPAADPVGATASGKRAVRGGAWISGARAVRPAYRFKDKPSRAAARLGFRPARTLPH